MDLVDDTTSHVLFSYFHKVFLLFPALLIPSFFQIRVLGENERFQDFNRKQSKLLAGFNLNIIKVYVRLTLFR